MRWEPERSFDGKLCQNLIIGFQTVKHVGNAFWDTVYNDSNKQTFWQHFGAGPAQSSVIWIIHHIVGLKYFFIYLNVCYYC